MAQNIDVVGVRAIFADLPEFLRSSATFSKQLERLDKNISQIGVGAKESQGAGLTGLAKLFLGPLSLGSLAVGKAIATITSNIASLVPVALEGAAAMQQMEIRFRNLIAAQSIESGQFEDFEGAMENAIGPSKELLNWVQEIALTTPFSFDSVANTIAFSMAMGETEEQAKELTLAIGNFTSGMGLNDEVMKRIIFNFGQMLAAGKVTGTELRDLARGAFFPINTILKQMAENMGIAVGDIMKFRKEVAAGTVDVQNFIKAFEDVVANRMPEAMKEMNRTWPAIINNVKDFIQIVLGIDLLGPVFNRITEKLADFVAFLNSPPVREGAQTIGLSLGMAFDSAAEGAGAIINALKEIIKELGITGPSALSVAKVILYLGTILKMVGQEIGAFIHNYILPFVQNLKTSLESGFLNAAKNALNWGFNIVYQLASGLIQGASQAITTAITFIQNLLSYWLEPGSPPRALPRITDWGAETMAEYLRGFSEADFGALDSVQNAVKGALEGLVALGMLEKDRIGTIFVDISEDLIAALDEFNRTGQITSDIFQQLGAIGGGFGAELATLLRLQLDLNVAIEAQAAAERALKAAQDARVAAGKAVNTAIRQYNAMLRKGVGKDALKDQLKIVNGAENQLHTAVRQQQAAEENKKAADDMVDVMKEQVKLQEKLLQQLIEMAKAQADLTGGAGGGPGEEFPPLEPPDIGGGGAGGTGFGESIKKLLDDLKAEIEAKLAGIWESLKQKWLEIIGPVLETIKLAWQAFVQWLWMWWDWLAKKLGLPTSEEIMAVWADFDGSWASFLQNLWETWDLFAKKLGLPTSEEILAIWSDFDGSWDSFLDNLGDTWDLFLLRLGLTDEWNTFVGHVNFWWGVIGQLWTAAMDLISELFTFWLARVQQWWVEHGANVSFIINTIFGAVFGIFFSWLGAIGDIIGFFIKIYEGIWIRHGDQIIELIKAPFQVAMFFIAQVLEAIGDLIDAGAAVIQGRWELAGSKIAEATNDIWLGIQAIAVAGQGAYETTFEIAGEEAQRILDGHLAEVGRSTNSAWRGVNQDVTPLVDSFFTNVSDKAATTGTLTQEAQNALAQAYITSWNNTQTDTGKIIADYYDAIAKAAATSTTDLGTENTNTELQFSTSWDAISKATGMTIDTMTSDALEAFDTNNLDLETTLGTTETQFSDTWQAIIDGQEEPLQTVTDNVVAAVSDAVTQSSAYIDDYQSLGENLLGGLKQGVINATQPFIDAVVKAVAAALAAAKAEVGSESPSVAFADLGTNIMLGLKEGIERTLPVVEDAMQKGMARLIEITEDNIKELGDTLDLAGRLGSIAGGIGNMFKQRFIDPLENQLKSLDKSIEDAKKNLAASEGDLDAMVHWGKVLSDLENQRVLTADQLAEKQEKLLHLQEQQAKLDLLQKQFDLLKLIQEHGLNPEDILGGVELGVNASLEDLLDAMTRAMTELVNQAQTQLQIHSPSMVFAKLGKQIMQGIALGMIRGRAAPQLAMATSMDRVAHTARVNAPLATPSNSISFGDMIVNNGMDAAMLRATIRSEVVRMMG